ncbi:MAG: M20/M25/M40 family metallo-hydrolase [Firmicutes bacterium]|nr:M20/M25/M40 family metallo-hydrolase [Bacillota bacterium]
MAYEISEKVQKTLNTLTADPKVKEALKFMEDDQEFIIQRQIELTLIPGPTFHEQKKAARMVELFKEYGLEDCHVDEHGNAVGIMRGTGGGKTTLVEGHMDTVFPEDTKLEIRRENGWIYCPGIVDDTRGCASVLSVIRAIRAAGIQPKGDIHFVGTVEEEGMGAFGGMGYYVTNHPELQASVSIDGSGFSEITYEATGMQTYEINFYGIGGHAFGSFGEIANPAHAAGRAIAKIADIQVPAEPKTTYAVSGLYGGSYASIHAIVKKATFTINFRSNGQKEMMELSDKIFKAIQEACDEETARWGKDTITWDFRHFMDVDANTQDPHAPIVESSIAIARFLGADDAKLGHGGCTNCSRALEAHLPAVCLGGGTDWDSRCHSLDEQFCEKDAFKGCQSALLLTLMCTGTEATETVIE